MPIITLPDGTQKAFEQPVTVAEVAASIGAGLASAALAGRVNDALVDTSFAIQDDSDLSIITARDEEGVGPKAFLCSSNGSSGAAAIPGCASNYRPND